MGLRETEGVTIPSLLSGSVGPALSGLSPPAPHCRLTTCCALVPLLLGPLPLGTSSPTLGPRACPQTCPPGNVSQIFAEGAKGPLH